MKEIMLDAPNLGELEKNYLNKCIDSTFVSTVGPFIPEFESKFSNYIGTEKAVSCQSGTSALHVSLYELGIKPGDEVIVPATTFIATVNPIMYLGATPVFVDIDPKTWNIDPVEIENNITKNTKAIIPVHLYGNPCDMEKIMEISKKYNIPIIEDATESLGAKYHGHRTGTFGFTGCFSFNGNKVMTTGGGGMIVTNNIKRAEHLKFLVNQARDISKGYYHSEIGFNYRMTNLEASLGLAQFERFPDFLKLKKEFLNIYKEEFENNPKIQFQESYENSESSCWLPSVIFNTDRTIPEIQNILKELRIPSRRIFIPIVEFPPFKQYKNSEYKNAYNIYNKGLNLPGSTVNTKEQIRYVAKKINEVI